MPTQADFRKVTCQDISSTGFSYFTSRKPATEQVIIALGAIPFIFYAADIMHANPVNHDGMVEYLVGCRLKNRIERES